MSKPKRPKVNVLYSVNLSGQEFDGPCDLTFFDIVQERGYFVVRYYGCCSVKTEQTFEDAKAYVRERAAFVLQKYKDSQPEETN